MLALSLFLVVLLAAWVYTDAQAKHDPQPALWALGTFLLAIIVLPVWLMKRGQIETAAQRRCPCCAESIQAAAVLCKHCGRDVEAADVDLAAAPNTPSAARLLTVIGLATVLGLAGVFGLVEFMAR